MDRLNTNNVTKHERILNYIESLKPGRKISVRKIARDLDVSEGTAYRAIKEAEQQGLVSTKERIGTVRIEKQKNIDQLTYEDVTEIVQGKVLGGFGGLQKTLGKFVIGAMELKEMTGYIHPGSLLIVGNREEAHRIALQQGAAVLITGGFDTTAEIKKLADDLNLPIISSVDDTFTVASQINRAIYDRLIKRKMMRVEDIMTDQPEVFVLRNNSTVAEWKKMVEATGHNRFPVVDEWNRVIGIITSKDVIRTDERQKIDKFMTRRPLTVHLHTSVAAAAHSMVWEGIELLPVVDSNRKLIGVISRQDVLKAMQYTQKQPQVGETFEDLIEANVSVNTEEDGEMVMTGMITPQMTNAHGMASEGVLTILMMKAAYRLIQTKRNRDMVLENITTYFIRPVQMETKIQIRPRMIEISRKFGKIDVEVRHDNTIVAKAMLTAQVIDRM